MNEDEMKAYFNAKGYLVIKQTHLSILVEKANKYQALIDYGVDNWSGFEDAMQSLECSESEDEE